MKELPCPIHPKYQALCEFRGVPPAASDNPTCRCRLMYINAKRLHSSNPKHNRSARRGRPQYPPTTPSISSAPPPGRRPRRERHKRFYKDLSLRDQILTSVSPGEITGILHRAGKLSFITPGTVRALTRAAHLRLKELETA